MFAFNHYFHFLNESNFSKDVKKQTIDVVEKSNTNLSNLFSIRSPWVTMTLRNVRYYSNARFEQLQTVESWALEIEDIVTLIWTEKGEIHYIKGFEYTVELLKFWVLHTFFPLVLELQRSARILHVGGVLLERKAILFSAFSFGGKSTLTDYFLSKNHTLLGDDTVALKKNEHGYIAIASYPYCRPYRKPETLGNPIQNFASEPMPVQAIYHLVKSEINIEVFIEELHGIEKFKALNDSSFITFDFLKKEHMAFFSDIAKHIPMYNITVPWNIERLEEVYQAILSHNGV